MSLLPHFWRLMRPSRLVDHHLQLQELMSPFFEHHNPFWRTPIGYMRPWRLSEDNQSSTVHLDKNKFMVNLDVQHFKPEDITVKALKDNTVCIEGKHEEQQDEHGLITRHFIRKYKIPEFCDFTKLESKLSSDGVLTITAPRVPTKDEEGTTIPIQQTGEPLMVKKEESNDK